MILVPVNVYITQYFEENAFQFENSSDGVESSLDMEFIPQMNIALVHFTQAEDNRATFDRWDGICSLDMQKAAITCKMGIEDEIKFEFVLKMDRDGLTTIKNDNFDEFVRNRSRSAVTLPKKFRPRRWAPFSCKSMKIFINLNESFL